jgi:hypothetical protein
MPAAAAPRVAVAPRAEAWAADAIRRGGGELVRLDQGPAGLVWTYPRGVEELREALRAHPEISWVQLPMAGVERMAAAGVLDRQRQWTSAKGAYAEPVAEHALALLLAGLRHFTERARARSWGRPAGESLFDQPVTVLGGGGIAVAFLRLLEPFRARVTIVRHHAEPVEGAARTLGTERLHEALAGARAVVLALALTPQTRGLIGREEFEAMDQQAWLVNVARGGLVDTEALVEALRSGRIEFVPAKEPGLLAHGAIAADGTFTLQTRQPGDGAIPGDYKVRILIPEKREFSRLARYRDEDSSRLTATVRAEPNNLEAFRLR